MANRTATKIDWDSVTSCIAAMEQQELLPYDEKTKAYVRFQRFLREQDFPSGGLAERLRFRDGVLQIASEFQLNVRQAARLWISLVHLKALYRIGSAWEDVPSYSATARSLEKIEGSIARVAEFLTEHSPRSNRALHFIINAANRWAEGQSIDELDRLGFTKTLFKGDRSGIEGVDYNAHGVVRQWFDFAPLLLEFTKAAQGRLKELDHNSRGHSEVDSSAIIQLVGNHLPTLYRRVTGLEYGISNIIEPQNPAKDKGVQDVGGVRFVRMSLEAMGMNGLKPETIANYRKRYRKLLPMVQQGSK